MIEAHYWVRDTYENKSSGHTWQFILKPDESNELAFGNLVDFAQRFYKIIVEERHEPVNDYRPYTSKVKTSARGQSMAINRPFNDSELEKLTKEIRKIHFS